MDLETVQDTIVRRARAFCISLREAGDQLAKGLGLPAGHLDSAVQGLLEEAERNQILDGPSGVARRDEARRSHWYAGPLVGEKYWKHYLEATGLPGKPVQFEAVDRASTKIVAHLADPSMRGNKKKGLVVGYVQSGKTANYAAVLAKAADAGYRIGIVLSGLHNNLRKQTQVRLNHDLGVPSLWDPLTSAEQDFGSVSNGTTRMATKDLRMLAVVKKNSGRLTRLRDWLHDIPLETRRRCPVLIIDDEADQATPNTRAARDEMSGINQLIREIWAEIPTGTYVGYTATPFANVFMDPNDQTDMYPEDFIIDLPRPPEYYGAERIFGTPLHDSSAKGEDGQNMARTISDEEAAFLNAPTRAVDRVGWTPQLPQSLIVAVRWFVLATATRRAREGVDRHSSMLVHTTPYIQPHFQTKELLDALLDDLADEVASGDLLAFRDVWDSEHARVKPLEGRRQIAWEEVEGGLEDAIRLTTVVVDNGVSQDRLDYRREGPDGSDRIETVIAVGGSTLSRGLTLEGLVVSYFTRVAKAYDTLLQMGRWFGFRDGYEDLPRVWLTAEIMDNFRFLAQVEWEIREEMRDMEARGVSPYQYGLRVRAHPGNLAITSRSKMFFASEVQVSYSGQRHQTIQFEERDTETLRANLGATKELLAACVSTGEAQVVKSARVFRGVGVDAVERFLAAYRFYPGGELNGARAAEWIRRFAGDRPWNVAVVSRAAPVAGTVDLGPLGEVNAVVRAPLQNPTDYANIKGLMTKGDAVLDLGGDAVARVNAGESFQSLRLDMAQGRGLLVIYPISKHSQPMHAVERTSRRSLRAEEHLVGLGIVFPQALDGDVSGDGSFLAVRPDWAVEFDEGMEDVLTTEDTEGDFSAPDLTSAPREV